MKNLSNKQIVFFVILITVATLYFLGRNLWCPAGDFKLWSFDIWSQHNSQHLLDWYTPSHISHGLLFCLLFQAGIFKRIKGYAFSLAIILESAWEILENSDFIINRYREATMAYDYFGDSILNSMSDIAWCALGFWAASKLKVWQVLSIFLAFELFTLYFVRDNLTLNVIMLLYPIDAIKLWQMPA